MLKKLSVTILTLIMLVNSALAIEPAIYDLFMQAGEDFKSSLQLKDGNNRNMNLTGYSYKAQLRAAPAPNGNIYANLSTVFTNITGGRLDIRLSKAQTTTNSGKIGVWDLKQTDPSGTVTYIIRGKGTVTPTVTR